MRTAGKITGIILRGVTLGNLLLLAILVMVGVSSGEYIFRYQGF